MKGLLIHLVLFRQDGVLVALLPPGAFILAGLLLGIGKAILGKHEQGQTGTDIREAEG